MNRRGTHGVSQEQSPLKRLPRGGRAVASSRVHIPADIDGSPRGVAKNFLILLQITPATPAENHCTL